MLEANGGFRKEAIDTLPRHFTPGFGEAGELLDFGLVGCQLRVAKYAFADRWDGGCGLGVGSAVAIEAGQTHRYMLLMGIGDGLLGRRRDPNHSNDANSQYKDSHSQGKQSLSIKHY
jgi:hypothetical protein